MRCIGATLLLVAACGDGSVDVTAKALNGATPTASARLKPGVLPPAAPLNGNWLLSPNQMRVKLTTVNLTQSRDGTGPGTVAELADCTIPYDIAKPGLATLVECPMTLEPGTYEGFNVGFDASYEVLIDDPDNGFFSDPASPSKLSTTAPAGGAQFVTFSSGDRFGGGGALPGPLTIADGEQLTVNVVINGLQFLKVNVSGSSVTIGTNGNGDPSRPGMTASFSGDLARVGYYVQEEIGTAQSRYAGGDISSPPPPRGITAVEAYYSSATDASLLFIGLNDPPAGCGPLGVAGARANNQGYLGRDATGTLGWAFPSDMSYTSWSVELAMAEKQNLGEATTLLCRKITSDPMPPGGTYASGAPMIASPDYSVPMILVAK